MLKHKILAAILHLFIQAPGHVVTLTWTSPTDMATGDSINVMRGTAAGMETLLTNLRADPTTGAFPVTYVYTSYTDGVTYYYTVVHVRAKDGKLSVPSNEVAATIPTDTVQPPTTLGIK